MGRSIVPSNRKYSRECPRCKVRHWTTTKSNKAICKDCKLKNGGKTGVKRKHERI